MLRIRLLLLLVLGFAATLSGCTESSSPLQPLAGHSLRSISISNHEGRSVSITEPKDIEFITSHLSALPSRREGKVNPEFVLEFFPVEGSSLRLRLERGSIGPAVPASDVVTRWYFPDSVLYDYIAKRIHGALAG